MGMKELYDKVMASDELKASFTEAAKSKDALEKWLKDQGSSASVEEVLNFLQEQANKTGEVSDDELESVAGGGKGTNVFKNIVASVGTIGLVCGAEAIRTATAKTVGKNKAEDGNICEQLF